MSDDAELAAALHNLHCAADCGNPYAVALEREFDAMKGRQQLVPDAVYDLIQQYAHLWRDRDDAYWLARLMEEVGECAAASVFDHEHTVDTELAQVASIAINWLRKRSFERIPAYLLQLDGEGLEYHVREETR